MSNADAQPLTITSSNCDAMVGASWKWTVRFAKAHGVPLWRLGTRPALPAAQLLAALAAAAQAAEPETKAARMARLKERVSLRISGRSPPA